MPKQQQQQSTGWPKLTQKQLTIERINDHMFLVPGVLSVSEAQRFIDSAEAIGFEHQGSRGPRYGEAFRDNDRIAMDSPELAEQLWSATGLRHTMQGVVLDGAAAVGLNPNIRFYRYSPGQKFGKHIDDSVDLAAGQFTGYTLLIYLSGRQQGWANSSSSFQQQQPAASGKGSIAESSSKVKRKKAGTVQQGAAASSSSSTSAVQPLLGGETIFYGMRGRVVASVAPVPGLALLHRHGEEHCLEHEGAAVLQGVKYILRSDVVFSNS